MPNSFAYIALLAWPFISLLFFRVMRGPTAAFLTIVAGYMLLPAQTSYDLPFIPPLNKENIPALSALLGTLLVKRRRLQLRVSGKLEMFFILSIAVCPLLSHLGNGESTFDGSLVLPGMSLYDTFSMVFDQITFLLPLLVGAHYCRSLDDFYRLMVLMILAGLLYTLPVLLELRLSPLLHKMVYGFRQQGFLQVVRFGGYRPLVFFENGLALSMFLAVVAALAANFSKVTGANRKKRFGQISCIYLLVILLLCKSVAATILGLTLILAIYFIPPPVIKRLFYLIALVILLYPVFSISKLVPYEYLVEIAQSIDSQRGQSLEFRFTHERVLVEHANEKMLFGWSGWGRNRLDGSITDSYWLIKYGQVGLFGLFAVFGLFLAIAYRGIVCARYFRSRSDHRLMIFIPLLICVFMADQYLNSSVAAWWMFLIGGYMGALRSIKAQVKRQQRLAAIPNDRLSRIAK